MPFEQFSKAAKQRREYVDALLHDLERAETSLYAVLMRSTCLPSSRLTLELRDILSEVERYRKSVAAAYEELSVRPQPI
jgi:hypothetical protein